MKLCKTIILVIKKIDEFLDLYYLDKETLLETIDFYNFSLKVN